MTNDPLSGLESLQQTVKPKSFALPPETSGGRLWKIGLPLLCLIGIAAVAAKYIPDAMTPPENGPKLTHTIKREDLIVTVTEQGTLESANNLEIRCKVEGWSTVNWVIEGGSIVKPGDELVRIDSSEEEESLSQRKIDYQNARAELSRIETEVAKAKIAIPEYLEGRYQSQIKLLQKNKAIAESNLSTTKNMLDHTLSMFKRGYVSELEVEGTSFTLQRAKLELEVINNDIKVLNQFTKAKELETLNGALKAMSAKLDAQKAQVELQRKRLDHQEEQLAHCVIVATQAGMVIHPSAAQWKDAPDVEEGANVHTNQVLLMMPDLSEMQVKMGIHESMIDRVKAGLTAAITLQDSAIKGEVASVAEVTRPAGWWTGNVVKFETIVAFGSDQDLRPGMSAEVEIIIARHENVLTIPVAAVVQMEEKSFCWVKTATGVQRHPLRLGDSNDQFIVVESGLKEGDQVVLNPLAFIEDVQMEVLMPVDSSNVEQPESAKAAMKTKSQEAKKSSLKNTGERPKTSTVNPQTPGEAKRRE